MPSETIRNKQILPTPENYHSLSHLLPQTRTRYDRAHASYSRQFIAYVFKLPVNIRFANLSSERIPLQRGNCSISAHTHTHAHSLDLPRGSHFYPWWDSGGSGSQRLECRREMWRRFIGNLRWGMYFVAILRWRPRR